MRVEMVGAGHIYGGRVKRRTGLRELEPKAGII